VQASAAASPERAPDLPPKTRGAKSRGVPGPCSAAMARADREARVPVTRSSRTTPPLCRNAPGLGRRPMPAPAAPIPGASVETEFGRRGQAGRYPARRLASVLRRQGFLPTSHFLQRFRERVLAAGAPYNPHRFGRDFDAARHGAQTRPGYRTRIAWVHGIPLVYRLGGHGGNRVVLVTAYPPEQAPPTRRIPPPRRKREAMSAADAEREATLTEFFDGPPPCSDREIIRRLRVRPGRGRNQLHGFDAQFDGPAGRRLRDMVVRAARRVRIHPALLAVNALAEKQDRTVWLAPGPIANTVVGLDFWDEHRRAVTRRLRLNIPTTVQRAPCLPGERVDAQGRCIFVNEQGRPTAPIHEFRSVRDAMMAMAARLRVLELELGDAAGRDAWSAFPEAVRHALTRYAYNRGPIPARALARRAARAQAAGRNPTRILPPPGGGPLRIATIRAAQAMHLGNRVFGRAIPCP
jgi:hypothetical protein